MNPESMGSSRNVYEGLMNTNSGVNMIITFRDGYIKTLNGAKVTQYGLVGTMRDTNNKDKVTHIPWEAIKFATEE